VSTRAGEKSGIKKRHFHCTAQTIADHPEFLDRAAPSLDARLGITQDAVPELAAAAAARAIAEWGRPATDITHLVVTTNSSAHAPGADLRLAALLGLRPTVQRTLLYFHGCFGGCSALRVAKDLAENNRGARVLVASSEVTTLLTFRAPEEAHLEALVAMALLGDGAGAVIIGAGGPTAVERPIFYMVSASQATLPGTEHALSMQLGTSGMELGISAEVPALLRGTIEGCLADMLAPLGVPVVPGAGWNDLFWAVHPGGRAILDSCEAALTLDAGKLAASRHVLSEYGNMIGATVFFILDEIRCRRQDGDDDCESGVMLGIGPGITVEMMVLQAAGSQGRKC
jgi:predicted naringenin-chalcone synthase